MRESQRTIHRAMHLRAITAIYSNLQNTMKLALLFLLATLTSCSLTVAPDGSRTWTMSGEQAARAIEILSAK